MRRYLEAAGLTDVGQKRKINEDSLLIDEKLGLLIVADGMGGHDAGEVASSLAVKSIRNALGNNGADLTEQENLDLTHVQAGERTVVESDNPALSALFAAIQNTNQRIYNLNQERNYRDGAGMGTTVAGLWLYNHGRRAAIFHVGDSRLYCFRGGQLLKLTRDHTLYQVWRDEGCNGEPPKRNIVLRALGPWGNVEPDLSLHTLESGDLVLICSDGLTGMISDQLLQHMLRVLADASLDSIARQLVGTANKLGGHDNITVALARIS
jgi:serine/threonine protein phosphatase PrpC